MTMVRLDTDLAPVLLILCTTAISVIAEVLAARQAARDTAAEYPARE